MLIGHRAKKSQSSKLPTAIHKPGIEPVCICAHMRTMHACTWKLFTPCVFSSITCSCCSIRSLRFRSLSWSRRRSKLLSHAASIALHSCTTATATTSQYRRRHHRHHHNTATTAAAAAAAAAAATDILVVNEPRTTRLPRLAAVDQRPHVPGHAPPECRHDPPLYAVAALQHGHQPALATSAFARVGEGAGEGDDQPVLKSTVVPAFGKPKLRKIPGTRKQLFGPTFRRNMMPRRM